MAHLPLSQAHKPTQSKGKRAISPTLKGVQEYEKGTV